MFIVDEGAPRANFEHVKTFLENTVSLLDVKKDCIRTGLVTYSSEPRVISLLNAETNRADILNKIQGLSSRAGKANMGAALKVTREKVFVEYAGSRKTQSVNQIATLITHRASDDHVSEAARDLRRTGVTVFAIGVENANETQLTQIASYPQPQYVTTLKKFVDLTKEDTNRNFKKKLFNQIQNKLYVQTERSKDLKTGSVFHCFPMMLFLSFIIVEEFLTRDTLKTKCGSRKFQIVDYFLNFAFELFLFLG